MTDTKLGLTLSSEEHTPRRLVELAAEAEQHGFDFVSISDHFHPWIDEQGHSPFVWAVLGGIAERTTDLQVAVGVTCPTTRIHPVDPGPGDGDRRQPDAREVHLGCRHWRGAQRAHHRCSLATGARSSGAIGGSDRADPPDCGRVTSSTTTGSTTASRMRGSTTRLIVRCRSSCPPSDRQAAEVAARHGDGLWTSGSASEALDHWRAAGGEGPVYSQLTFCWAADRDTAVEQAHRIWPNSVVPGQLSQDLPTPKHFEQATSIVTPQMIAESMPCGPDVDALVKGAQELIDSGVDHLYFHQVGDDQAGFLDVWDREIRPALGSGE